MQTGELFRICEQVRTHRTRHFFAKIVKQSCEIHVFFKITKKWPFVSRSLVYTQQSILVTFLSLAFLGIKIPSNQSQSSIVLPLVTRLCSEVSIILKQKPFIWSTTPWKPQLLKMQITFLDAECSETSIRVARSSWCRVLISPGISRVLSQMHFYFFISLLSSPLFLSVCKLCIIGQLHHDVNYQNLSVLFSSSNRSNWCKPLFDW